jgi:vanadium-dependent haloperoxidase-like protein
MPIVPVHAFEETERAGEEDFMSRMALTSIALCLMTVMIPATTVRADAVLDWNAYAAKAIVTVGGQVPPRALIRLAMVHLAIYDAVNAIEGAPFEGYASVPAVDRPASEEAAAATAAYEVLVALFPAQAADLNAEYAASLQALPDGIAKVNGIAVGQLAASALLTKRANDGRDAVVTYTPGTGPGIWVPTPPALLPAQAPETPFVQPFVLNSAAQFRPDPPFSLTSEDWARDYNEVKALGSAVGSTRTPEQTDIARFWSDNPPLQWNRAWRALSVTKGLGLADNARYFAMLASASADALIACWDGKYYYNFWRPVTAIRAGDTDGNPETAPDAAWIGLIVTPNHPEYPAAHGCFSGASTETLKYFFGTDNVAFSMESAVAGIVKPVRTYSHFSDALTEVLNARIYGGMHYRNSTRIGANVGKQVSRFMTGHFFRPR